MKKLSLLILSFLLFQTFFGQNGLPVSEKTGKYTFTEVVSAEGVSTSELYTEAKKWGEGHGFSVIEDTEGQKVKFDGSVNVNNGKVTFTFFIAAKDGKYRLIVTDFVHKGTKKGTDGGKLENKVPECGNKSMSQGDWAGVRSKTNGEVKKLIADLKRVIKEYQNDPEKSDDW